MKRPIMILLLGLISLAAIAQYDNSVKDQADKAFATGKYFEAAYYYKKLADGMHISGLREIPYEAAPSAAKGKPRADKWFVMYRLAESYRLYHNFIEAEPWYAQVVNGQQTAAYPLAQLWYGVCLRANQRFEEAIKQLQAFDATYTGDKANSATAKQEIANCKFALEQYRYPMLFTATKLKGQFNSDGSNYAMAGDRDKLIFTSSRAIKDDKQHLNKLYLAGKDDMGKPEVLNLNLPDAKKDEEIGTAGIYGDRIYFTRWFPQGNKTRHLIYLNERSGDKWGTPHLLNSNVNADGYDAIQPFVSADGKKLYFASNKPGGQGGYDIWQADLDNAGNPTNSFNLGSTINTPADEQAPWVNARQTKLVYSSKGFTGLGGFDLFESADLHGKWQAPVNMGSPINSAKDDQYYFPNPADPSKFFLCSDRESDCCLDLFIVTDQRFTITGTVTDCTTNKPLTGVRVTLQDSVTKNVLGVQSLNGTNNYSFKIATKRPYQLTIEKAGYFTKTIAVGPPAADTLRKIDPCLQSFVVGKPIELKNILYDYGSSALRPESEQELLKLVAILKDNPKLKVELSAHTDGIGSDAYNLKLSQQRAQSCVDFIKSKGIDDSRIFAKGYGKSKPIAPNTNPDGSDNPDGRQKNRRTEFTVLKEN